LRKDGESEASNGSEKMKKKNMGLLEQPRVQK